MSTNLNKIPAVFFTSLNALWRPVAIMAERYPAVSNVGKILLSTLVPALLKPYTFDRAYQREAYFSEQERKLMMTQESIRQFVSIGLYFGSAIASWFVSKKLFPAQKGFSHLTNTLLGSAVLDTFLRPVITAKLSRFFPSARLNGPTIPMRRIADEAPALSFRSLSHADPELSRLDTRSSLPALPTRIGNWPPQPIVTPAWTQWPNPAMRFSWQSWQNTGYANAAMGYYSGQSGLRI